MIAVSDALLAFQDVDAAERALLVVPVRNADQSSMLSEEQEESRRVQRIRTWAVRLSGHQGQSETRTGDHLRTCRLR